MFYDFVLRSGYNFTLRLAQQHRRSQGRPRSGWGVGSGCRAESIQSVRGLPPTDVELGSASSANTANNGHRDIVMYQLYLQPKVFIPGHMTTGTNGVGESSTQELFFMYRSALANMGTVQPVYTPEIRWLVDPTDYIRPIVFTPGDPRWSNPAKAARLAQFCS